jgi:hypothetical protein
MTTARSLERRGLRTLICMALLVIVGLIMWLASALAEPLPVPKPSRPGGSCPHGYLASGLFCVPGQGGERRHRQTEAFSASRLVLR